jgi:hypothetical protein
LINTLTGSFGAVDNERNTMTRVYPILAIAGLLTLSVPVCAQTTTPKDFDLSCAVAANIELARAPAGTDARGNATVVAVFYLGRLSGRDDQTHWAAEIKKLVAEKTDQESPDTVKQCADLFRQKLE